MGLSSKVCEFITDDVYNVDKGLFETEDKLCKGEKYN